MSKVKTQGLVVTLVVFSRQFTVCEPVMNETTHSKTTLTHILSSHGDSSSSTGTAKRGQNQLNTTLQYTHTNREHTPTTTSTSSKIVTAGNSNNHVTTQAAQLRTSTSQRLVQSNNTSTRKATTSEKSTTSNRGLYATSDTDLVSTQTPQHRTSTVQLPVKFNNTSTRKATTKTKSTTFDKGLFGTTYNDYDTTGFTTPVFYEKPTPYFELFMTIIPIIVLIVVVIILIIVAFGIYQTKIRKHSKSYAASVVATGNLASALAPLMAGRPAARRSSAKDMIRQNADYRPSRQDVIWSEKKKGQPGRDSHAPSAEKSGIKLQEPSVSDTMKLREQLCKEMLTAWQYKVRELIIEADENSEVLSGSTPKLSNKRSNMSQMSTLKMAKRDGLLAASSGALGDKKLKTTMAAVTMGALAKYHLDPTIRKNSSERLNGNKSNSSHSKNRVTPINSPLTKVKKQETPQQDDGVAKITDKKKRNSGHSMTSQKKPALAKSHISSSTIKATDSRSSKKKKRKASTSNTTVKRRESPLKKLKTQAIAE